MAAEPPGSAIPERDAALVLDMIIAAEDALEFVSTLDERGFLASRLHQNAVIRCLEIAGEAANRISPETRATHAEIPWREVTDLRNRLIHGYADVRLELVWRIVQSRLPGLLPLLRPLVPPDESG